jgi:DNA helicase HerA-like ATPase
MNNHQVLKDSIFKVGQVISIDGRKIQISVDKTKNSSHILYEGELLKNVSVGGYIKIIKGFTKIIAKVEGESIKEDKLNSTKNYKSDKDKINRVLNVSLLGFFKGNIFERGIKELPLVYNECYLLEKEEFNQIHNFIKEGDDELEIGVLSLERGQKISFGTNGLFASHIGIFGNTGSGKSYTLAKLYNTLFQKYKNNEKFQKNAKYYLFDFNGEYLNSNQDEEDKVIIEKEFKTTYNLSTRSSSDKFPIQEEEINDISFWSIFLEATEKTQTPFLKRALTNRFYLDKLASNEIKYLIRWHLEKLITNYIDMGIIIDFLYRVNLMFNNEILDMTELIKDFQDNLHLNSNPSHLSYYYSAAITVYENQDAFKKHVYDKIDDLVINIQQISYLSKIQLRIIFQYFKEYSGGNINSEHISPLLKRIDKKISDLDKVIYIPTEANNNENILNVISLKDVNIDMKKVLPLLIAKQIYDKQKRINDKTKYLNIIIDEAHNIMSKSSDRESETWKDYRLETFEEIIKEGRKFGVFLTIASQRPSDISPTILSQLHNYFLHRLINNNDILAVEKTISYLDKVSFEYLPILPTGSCIVAGLSAQVPVVIDIGSIKKEFEPRSETIKLTENWN